MNTDRKLLLVNFCFQTNLLARQWDVNWFVWLCVSLFILSVCIRKDEHHLCMCEWACPLCVCLSMPFIAISYFQHQIEWKTICTRWEKAVNESFIQKYSMCHWILLNLLKRYFSAKTKGKSNIFEWNFRLRLSLIVSKLFFIRFE